MNIALLGHGTVGTGVDEIAGKTPNLCVKTILSRTAHPELSGRETLSFEEILRDDSIDAVCEVMGGIHPAYEYLSAAMKAGKHCVTANKAVVAAYYSELCSLAKEHHVSFRCTAAVGGGIAWLTALERSLKTDRILNIEGIMNGTTNFILSEMESGADYASVLSKAQALGYAEKDPTADVCGFDVRRKIAISANIAFGVVLDENEIPTFGIESIHSEDFENAKSLGGTVRLLAKAAPFEDAVSAYVMPRIVSSSSLYANTHKNYNLLSLTAEHNGTLSLYGQGAGMYPTAQNVISDLNDIDTQKPAFYTDSFVPETVTVSPEFGRFYVRTTSPDEFLVVHSNARFSNGAVATAPVSKKEFISWAISKKAADKELFIAEISEELC